MTQRSFNEWWKTVSSKVLPQEEEATELPPVLNKVNYVWISSIIDKEIGKGSSTDSDQHHNQYQNNSDFLLPSSSLPQPPTPDEMLEWIISGQIDAKGN